MQSYEKAAGTSDGKSFYSNEYEAVLKCRNRNDDLGTLNTEDVTLVLYCRYGN